MFAYGTNNCNSVGKTFSLSPSTGQLELSALGLSYERKQLYTYQIRVTDQVCAVHPYYFTFVGTFEMLTEIDVHACRVVCRTLSKCESMC